MTNDFFTETEISLFIPRYVEHIRRDLPKYIKDEGYKYLAVATFRKEFDIDAPNLSEMLHRAFSRTKNLVGSGKYYPARMLELYAKKDPEFVRATLRGLTDHSVNVGNRVDAFISTMNAHFKEDDVQSYFDYRFVSFILGSLFPEKYIYVKSRETKVFAEQVKYSLPHGDTNGERYLIYLIFSELVRSVLAQSSEILEVHEDIVADSEYKDESLSWCTIDFIFNCVRRLNVGELTEISSTVAKRESYRNEAIEQYNDAVITDEYFESVHQTPKSVILEQATAYVPVGDGYKLVNKVGRVRIDNALQKLRVKELEDHTCQVCETVIEYKNSKGQVRRFAHADHIQDKAKGGNESLSNLWVLCPNCHALKTYGVIEVDADKKKVFRSGKEISIRDHHLGWGTV